MSTGGAVPPTAHLGQHLDAGLLGHAPVEDGHLVLVGTEVGQGVGAVGHGVDHIALLAETPLEDRAQPRVVLGHQHPHRRPGLMPADGTARAVPPALPDDAVSGPAIGPQPDPEY